MVNVFKQLQNYLQDIPYADTRILYTKWLDPV